MQETALVFVLIEEAGVGAEICKMLEEAGLRCQRFEQAQAFLAGEPAARPGCLVLDVTLPGISASALAQRFGTPDLLPPMVLLSPPQVIPPSIMGLKMGLVEFIEKPVQREDLLAKVRSALELDIRRRAQATELVELRCRLEALTARERQLLHLLVAGHSNKQVAAELGISIKTVENHRAHLMAKMGALNAADLVRLSAPPCRNCIGAAEQRAVAA